MSLFTATRIFIDTGYLLARAFPRDQWHAAAKAAAKHGHTGITSSLVINETMALLQLRGHFSLALEILRTLRESHSVQVVYVDPVLQGAAWDLFPRWGSSGATPVDCASFAIMKQMSIRKAFTFDRHFEVAGFATLLPPR